MHKNMEGPETLKSNVRSALCKMNRDTAKGSDGIVTEILVALDDFKTDKITRINKTYMTEVSYQKNLSSRYKCMQAPLNDQSNGPHN